MCVCVCVCERERERERERDRLCLSVRPSVGMGQLGSHWTDFHKIWYLNIFKNSFTKIKVLLKSDKLNGHFT